MTILNKNHQIYPAQGKATIFYGRRVMNQEHTLAACHFGNTLSSSKAPINIPVKD